MAANKWFVTFKELDYNLLIQQFAIRLVKYINNLIYLEGEFFDNTDTGEDG